MENSNDEIFKLLSSASEIFGAGKIPDDFIPLLKQISEGLLSTNSNESNSIKITENFQGLVYCLCKLIVVSRDQIDNETFYLIFKTIISLTLHFFSSSKNEFSKFISEFPISFAESYTISLINNFFTIENNLKLQLLSIHTFLLFFYFIEDQNSEKNPFCEVISKLINDELCLKLYKSLQNIMQTVAGNLLMSTLLKYNESFVKIVFDDQSENLNWIISILPHIQKDYDQSNELRMNLLLLFTKNDTFCEKIANNQTVINEIIRNLITFIRHYLKEDISKRAIHIAHKVLVNLARYISNFDSDTGEMLIGLLRIFQVSKGLGDRIAEYCRLLILFIETILINRLEQNIELLYCVMRSTDVLRKMSSMKEKSKDPFDFARSLINVDVIAEYFSQRMLEAGDQSNDYEAMVKYLSSIIKDWKPTNILTIPPPIFDFEEIDHKHFLKTTRIIILKEMRSLL